MCAVFYSIKGKPKNLHPPTPGLYNLHMELKDHPPFELKARSAYWIDDAVGHFAEPDLHRWPKNCLQAGEGFSPDGMPRDIMDSNFHGTRRDAETGADL